MLENRQNSKTIYEACCKIMPGGVSSPLRAFTGLEITPLIVQKGKGSKIWDVDERCYLDYCCSWGALILGHADNTILAPVIQQMYSGTSFGLTTSLELELAHKISKHFPSMEKIRFVSSGTEAAMSSVRLARAYTQKNLIVKFEGHYHGHSDSLLAYPNLDAEQQHNCVDFQGIPSGIIHSVLTLPFNDIEQCRRLLNSRDDIAAVILEPIAGNMGVVPAEKNFLEMLREITYLKGIVLIFDEVITGFRIGLSGAQGHYRIFPDLTCLGKIIGGGFPAAAFGGKKEIMNCLAPLGNVYQAGTLSGNPIAMQAGIAQITELEKEGIYPRLETKTAYILEAVQRLMKNQKIEGSINSIGSMFTPFFGSKLVKKKINLNLHLYRMFLKHLLGRGVYFSPSAYEANFVSLAHSSEDLEKTCEAISAFSFDKI